MKANGWALEISVRVLTDEEKAADPDHDYELFDGLATLKGAEKLGWTTLRALVYAIDEWEGVRLHNFKIRHSIPLTWIEIYDWLGKRMSENPKKSVAEWAVSIEEDPTFMEEVLPVLKLLNEPAKNAICQSIRKCSEEGIDMGGYRFYPEFAILLEPLKSYSKDLLKTQKVVEQVVNVAIEKELYREDIKALVDWTLDGNDPNEFYLEEA